jgi:hypothetical protein
MSLSYAWQKLKESVSYLASTEGDLRGRLKWAYGNFLAGPGWTQSWGDDAGAEWSEFTAILGAFQPIGGANDAPIDRMKPDDLKKLAERIVALFSEVAMRDPNCINHPRGGPTQ